MYGQKFGRKLIKPLKLEKAGMGKREHEARQCSKDWEDLFSWSRRQRILWISQKRKMKNVKDLCLRRCREKDSKASWKRVQEPNFGNDEESNSFWLYCGISWIYETTSRIFAVSKPWGSHCRKRDYFYQNLVHKFMPISKAMKIPDAKAAVDKEWKKLETIPAWDLEKSRARRRLFWKHRDTDGHMSRQKCGVRTQIAEVQRQSRAPGDFVCRQIHLLHATFSHEQSLHRSHSTDDICTWLKFELRPQNASSIHASCFTLRLAAHCTPPQVLSRLSLSCYCRPRLQTRTCCPRIHLSIVKIHGRIVLLRNSTPPQVMSPRRSNSTGFWSNHKSNNWRPGWHWRNWCQTVVLQPIIDTFSLRFGRKHCDAARLGRRRRAIT